MARTRSLPLLAVAVLNPKFLCHDPTLNLLVPFLLFLRPRAQSVARLGIWPDLILMPCGPKQVFFPHL